MTEGCVQNYVTALEGGGATPSFHSSYTEVGVWPWWTGILLNLPGADRLCIGRAHDQLSSGVGSIVVVPG